MINKELNKQEFRKYAVKGKGVNGLALDRYVERVENMTRAVIEETTNQFQGDRCFFKTDHGQDSYFWDCRWTTIFQIL